MACCVIGCKCDPDRDIVWEIPIEFKNHNGDMISTKIKGCRDHVPPDIFKRVTPEQKLFDKGY